MAGSPYKFVFVWKFELDKDNDVLINYWPLFMVYSLPHA